MNKTLIILILALIFIAIVTGAVISRKPTAISPSTENRTEIPGLVLPHHDLAQGIIINTVKKLAEIQPDIKYIAVLSPNHYRPESDTFTSAMILKNFPIATDKIEAIQNAYPRLVMDEKLLDREHGLYVPMTYLTRYFPQAVFVPIAVSPHFNTENLKKMAEILAGILPSQSLIVASTDFSHNHSLTEAYLNDLQTISAIKDFNFRKLLSFDDNNIDSPTAMATVMYVMQLKNATGWETWQESHGAEITGNPQLSGTSYVTGVFKKFLASDKQKL